MSQYQCLVSEYQHFNYKSGQIDLEKDALVAMAELICAFRKFRLPADANLPKTFYLLTGQLALHHCLARVLLTAYALK